ncbi:hypothetical protein D915_005688 [Fasciola hepatica]|uniref:Uncharacterized protein n=1 Tax=Fasciola hepatica TaxID=6192 RepID=A0A4E0R469_FASHE|nr:hypothetical protein D915_005688 [Fasciola hepatica]
MKIHNDKHTRSFARSAHSKNKHELITLTNIRGMNHNTDSVHRFLQPSLLALFLTETQISPSSDTTHLQFLNYTFHSSFHPKLASVPLSTSLSPHPRIRDLDFSNRELQLMLLKLRLPYFNHYFCVVYRSPNSSNPGISAFPPLGSSDHCIISCSISFTRPDPPPTSRHTFWRYSSANRDGFRDFLTSYPWNDCCFTPGVSASVSNFTDIVLQGTQLFIPHFSKPGKPESLEWFNHAWDRAVRLKRAAFGRCHR